MTLTIDREGIGFWVKEMLPAWGVLVGAFLFTYFLDNASSVKITGVIVTILARFLRFALLLCLPLYLLSPIFNFIVRKIRGRLLQTDRMEELRLRPFKQWVFRPFQGIGIGLLFETKLLSALQIITGVSADPILLVPRSSLQPGRLLIISGITVIVSLLLSFLWTIDDIGIRYINPKDQEIRMIGKYIGTVMPILFGFYGIFSLVGNFPTVKVLLYLFKTIIILYPPFAVFTVIHTYFLKNRSEHFLQRVPIRKGGLWFGEK